MDDVRWNMMETKWIFNKKLWPKLGTNSYPGKGKARQSTINLDHPPCPWQITKNKPYAYSMHAKTSEENMHATMYL